MDSNPHEKQGEQAYVTEGSQPLNPTENPAVTPKLPPGFSIPKEKDMSPFTTTPNVSLLRDAMMRGRIHVIDETGALVEEDEERPLRIFVAHVGSEKFAKFTRSHSPRELSIQLRRSENRRTPTHPTDWPHDNRSNAYPERFAAWLEEHPDLRVRVEDEWAMSDLDRMELAFRWFGDDAKEAFARLDEIRAADAEAVP